MGTQAMSSQTGNRQQSPVQSLARQGSLYSLTLNEVQTHLGEPLNSMNLDDLLKNVFVDIETTAASSSKKTVDEVWRDIQQKKSGGGRSSNQELGEMTLEDFLMKAGVVGEGGDKNAGVGNLGFPQGPHWVMGAYVAGDCLVANPVRVVGSSTVFEAVNLERQLGVMSDPQASTRKRGVREGGEEKTVERRQKRMIKNRESAARSRARKQVSLQPDTERYTRTSESYI